LDPADVAQSPTRIAELILAAREGSAEALGQLMKFSRQYLLVIANDELPAELQGKGGASDIVQETQLEAARAFASFRGYTAAELLGWLREIRRNNLRDFTRRFTGAAKRRVSLEVSLSDAEADRLFAPQTSRAVTWSKRSPAR
jgi:RNA polymerase sigma-70 factor (ECF subfamily)